MKSKSLPFIAIAVVALAAFGLDRYLVNAQEPVELPTVVYPAAAQEVAVNFGTSTEYRDLLSRVERLEGLLEGVEPMTVMQEPMAVMSRTVEVSRPRVQRTVSVERDGQLMSCSGGQCTVTRTRTRNSGILPRLFRR